MELPVELQRRIEGKLNTTLSIVNPVGGGDISNAALLCGRNGERYFLKWNATAPAGLFAAEARGLAELKKANVIRVPEVFCFEDTVVAEGKPSFIVLEYLEAGQKTREREEKLGEKLAGLHQVRADDFGFSSDNFIGRLSQVNTWGNSWGEFFFERRLLVQAEFGKKRGWFETKLLHDKQEQIISILNDEHPQPSLLHGDLWGGNVYWGLDGPALIDPAVYYGNREADLAFSEMFGGFSEAFYRTYHECYPLSSGYERRKEILNLYHYMTHANMFGGGYLASVRSILAKL